MTPTARTLDHLHEHGWLAEKVEQRLPIPGKFVTRDLFGFADVFAIAPDGECVLIQVTSGDHVAERVTKARAIIDASPHLLLSGLRMVVHGWRKNAKGRWTLRVVDLDPPGPPTRPLEA